MDYKEYFKFGDSNEKPLDRIVEDGGFCKIFRRIGCIGDSLSSGEFESLDENGVRRYHDMYEYSWGQFIARDCGSTVYNFSKGGMTAKEYLDKFGGAFNFWDKSKACQAYIIALGVNDLHGELPLGTTDDICLDDYNKNADTFAGYYGKIIQKYREIEPKSRMFLVTMPKYKDGKPRVEGHSELLYKMAELFEFCYVIDLEKYAPVYDEEFRSYFNLSGHMNPMGYLLTAKMIESYIDYIIRHNMDDFKQVGFIGTGYHNVDYKW